MTKTIAVHGATGSQGRPVAHTLAAAGHAVRPLLRQARVNLFDRASLEAAYAGADAAVLRFPLVYDETITADAVGARLRRYLGGHAADGTATVYRRLAESPPQPMPDPAPARAALDWAPRDVATWARDARWPLARAA